VYVEQNNKELDFWSLYLYAMKSPVTSFISEGWESFFDFIKLEGSTVEEKSKIFIAQTKKEGDSGFSILYWDLYSLIWIG
jgi:hypothetical protein